MNFTLMKEKATQGGCGLIALELIRRCPEAVPYLRYDKEDGIAVHAAVEIEDVFVHMGDDEGLVLVTPEELMRACEEDFSPDRTEITEDDVQEIVDYLLNDLQWR